MSLERYVTVRPAAKDINKRVLGIPYAGDGSHGLAAAFRSVGLRAEVMAQSCSSDSYEFADKFITTQTCEPFRIQVGDVFSWLSSQIERGYAPSDLAVLEPTAGGPCRLGQYPYVIRYFLDENGYKDVEILSPSSTTDYSEIGLPKAETKKLIIKAFKSILATDILYNAMLRIRPYEKPLRNDENSKTIGETIYGFCLDNLCKAIEKGNSIEAVMEESAVKFKKVLEEATPGNKTRYPIAVISGEFFMRLHPGSNHNLSKVLESQFSLPLETMVAPSMEWFNYITRLRFREAMDEEDIPKILKTGLKRMYMAHYESKLWKPFAGLLAGREMHDAMEYVLEAQDAGIYHGDIEGESPISIGLVNLFINNHFKPVGNAAISGICHVGPWQCMQETIATSVSQSLIRNRREFSDEQLDRVLPYVDIVFSDKPEQQWLPKLASFVRQCYQRRELVLGRK